MPLQPFEPTDHGIQSELAELWNQACGPALSITPRFVGFNTQTIPLIAQRGCLAIRYEQIQGFVLASASVGELARPSGWIDALAVAPNHQGQGVGSELLSWAEDWLRRQGCKHARLGGSLNPWTAGLPLELHSQPFFRQRGYTGAEHVWDVAHHLNELKLRRPMNDQPAVVAPLQVGQEHELLAFLHRAFPGRWAWEVQEFFRIGGRRSDCLVLRTTTGIEGFCRVTLEDSVRPIERFYPHGLSHPWGQLGPIGVSAASRGKGYGAALLDGGLSYLRDQGVNGCVIDWTTLIDLYGKWGFRPYREYAVLLKEW